MKSLQDWVYDVEAGPIRGWLVRIALLLLVVGLGCYMGIREFNGLRSFEAMDLAQQARQLAEGKGFTTLVIRPLALWQIRANLGAKAPAVTAFPETLTPPFYPVLLAAWFKAGVVGRILAFDLTPEELKGFRVFPPDVAVVVLHLGMVVMAAFFVYGWGLRQFDAGTGVLAVVFFLGSSPLWSRVVAGGVTPLVVLLYALSGWFLCRGLAVVQHNEETESSGAGWVWMLAAGCFLGMAALVQMIQVWPVCAAVVLATILFRQGKWTMVSGLLLAMGLFLGWLIHLWIVCGNPIGLNWAFLLADSPKFQGETLWRTYSFDVEKTDVWRRLGGSILRGFTDLLSQGPVVVGSSVAGTLALVGSLHVFRQKTAAMGRNFWGGLAITLILATAFIERNQDTEGHPVLMALLPVTCVYGAAYLWVLIDRWKLHLELLGRLFAIFVGLIAVWPTLTRLVLPAPAPFAYPPTYPPIFLFMRSWFEPGELQAADLPAAEAWYAEQPTLWLPVTREDFLKIHDRVAPVFSILLTPASSDARMYSQMLADDSEWNEWVDIIRRQKPPDLPQAFATSLPPNNDYLLLSLQKRWN